MLQISSCINQSTSGSVCEKLTLSVWLSRAAIKVLAETTIRSVSRRLNFCFLAISSGKGGLDGWQMMAIDDTGTDLWTVAGAWGELEGGGVAV